MSDQANTDRQLLREFIEQRSEPAFAELVRRHVDWIYAAARRQAGERAADDLTQAVFVVLLKKAHVAVRQPVLSAWLFRVLRYAVLRARRDEVRRLRHERQAARQASEISPPNFDRELLRMVDELLVNLREKDRRVILVRFYEQRSLSDVGQSLGISEEAARKRVDRAVLKLRLQFAQRGITDSPEILSALFAEQALIRASSNATQNIVRMKMSNSAIQFSKGAMRMMAIRQAGMIAVTSLAIGMATAGGLAAYAQYTSAAKPATASAASLAPARPMVNFVSSEHTFAAISRDGQVSGYSNTLGKWTPLQLSPDAVAEVKLGHLSGMIADQDVMVLAIHGNVYGYSPVLGQWTALPLDADARAAIAGGETINPLTSDNIIAVKIGNHIYGYSPMTGTWNGLMVDTDMPLSALSVQKDMVVINYDGHLAVFSVYTGKWNELLVGKDMPMSALSLEKDMAVINYDDHLTIFSAHTGKWAKVVWAK